MRFWLMQDITWSLSFVFPVALMKSLMHFTRTPGAPGNSLQNTKEAKEPFALSEVDCIG